MFATYGVRRHGGRKASLPPPYTHCAHPILPEKVYSDRAPLCIGFPYPRHRLACWCGDSENCLRIDMRELEEKWQEERQRRKIN